MWTAMRTIEGSGFRVQGSGLGGPRGAFSLHRPMVADPGAGDRATEATSDAAAPALDPARQARAREYAGIRRRLFFLGLGIDAVLLIGFLAGGLSAGLRDFAEGLAPADGWWLALLIYFAALGIGYTLINLPLGYWSGYVLPHRFGLSHESRGLWVADLLKGPGFSASARSFPHASLGAASRPGRCPG